MKRGFLLLLIAVFLLPIVSATISITTPSQDEYNIGEEIDIVGYIQETEDTSGQLQLSLQCGSKIYKLQPVNVNLPAGQRQSFSQLSSPWLIASSSMRGTCKLKAELLIGGKIKESATSGSFEITGALLGSFVVDQSQIQRGDTIVLSGSITRLNGIPLEGTAEIYFVSEGNKYLMDFVSVTNGVVGYSASFENTGEAGEYSITIIARDSYGNEEEFEAADHFTVLDELQVRVDTNERVFSPGDVVNVFGEVKTALQEYVSIATVEISLDESTQSTALEESKFTQDITIPETITSGQHTITVDVKDTFGNKGSSTLTIEVESQATKIETSVSAQTLDPQTQLTIGVTLYDQTGEVMTDLVQVVIKDPYGKTIVEREVPSEEKVTYEIPQFAYPGGWTVKTFYQDEETGEEQVSTENTFSVNAIQKLEYEIIEDKLYIRNVGNVRYTDDVEIPIEGVDQEYLITKTKNMNTNETIVIDLAEELPTGMYTVSIPTGYDVSDVAITDGKERAAVTWSYTLLAILFILGLGYLIYARVRTRKEPSVQEEPNVQRKEKKIRLYDPKRAAEKEKKVNLTFEDKEHDLEDFKQRTLEEIRRTEERMKGHRSPALSEGKLGYVTGRNDPIVRQKPVAQEKEKPSLFSLFDK